MIALNNLLSGNHHYFEFCLIFPQSNTTQQTGDIRN